MRTLYQITRNTYDALLRPQFGAARLRRRLFYGGFVTPKCLAFDIGAFRGEVSEALAQSGARVIAVEPNPILARRLRRCFGPTLTVEQCAVGDTRGIAQLRLGHYAGHSTLSAEWAAIAGAERWAESIEVPVLSLDDLIARHGLPSFIKIDVEGHEPAVLAGLSQRVAAVSFEFQCAAIHLAKAAISRLSALGIYEFAVTLVDEPELRSSWGGGEWIGTELDRICETDGHLYGDVFARLR